MAFGFTAEHYAERDALWAKIGVESDPKYCFGLQIDTFNSITDEYAFQIMFLRKNIPDTLRPAYDLQILTPDYMNWDKYTNTGYLHIY